MVTFKTGDLGRLRPDGLIEFIGRKDHQIKLHGYRIDIGEVEGALRRVRGGRRCCGRGGRRRCRPAAIAGRICRARRFGVDGLSRRDLVSMLKKRLPLYMIPATLNIVGQLPRLPTLKIDRIRVAQLDATRVVEMVNPIDDPLVAELVKSSSRYSATLGRRLKTMCRLWAETRSRLSRSRSNWRSTLASSSPPMSSNQFSNVSRNGRRGLAVHKASPKAGRRA